MPVPLIVATMTTLSGVVAAVLAVSGTETGPLLTGGTASVAVGGYVYLVKSFLNGRLLAADTAAQIAGAQQREERLTNLVEDYKERVDLHEEQYRVRFEEYKEREDNLRALIIASHAAIATIRERNQ